MKVRGQKNAEKLEIPITPMIDIVFQLLIFFIMTLKIVTPEGDFNIKMPAAAPTDAPPEPDLLPPIKLRLTANDNGELSGIKMGEKTIPSFDALRTEILSMVGNGDDADEYEVEIDADYELQYVNIIGAVTAVTGQRKKDGTIEQLVSKVKFAPPKPGPNG